MVSSISSKESQQEVINAIIANMEAQQAQESAEEQLQAGGTTQHTTTDLHA